MPVRWSTGHIFSSSMAACRTCALRWLLIGCQSCAAVEGLPFASVLEATLWLRNRRAFRDECSLARCRVLDILRPAGKSPRAKRSFPISPGISSRWLCHSSVYRSCWSTGNRLTARAMDRSTTHGSQALSSSPNCLDRAALRMPQANATRDTPIKKIPTRASQSQSPQRTP
jgi:hypothetical protein